MKTIKRRRLSKQAWSEVMQRFEGWGATIGQFCAQEGVSTQSFYNWRGRLAAGVQAGAVTAKAPVVMRQRRSEAGNFIDLGELPDSATSRPVAAGLELRLELGGGVVLQIVRR